jgi:hypothetical protein
MDMTRARASAINFFTDKNLLKKYTPERPLHSTAAASRQKGRPLKRLYFILFLLACQFLQA